MVNCFPDDLMLVSSDLHIFCTFIYKGRGLHIYGIYVYIIYLYDYILYGIMILCIYGYYFLLLYVWNTFELFNFLLVSCSWNLCWGWWAAQHFATSPVWRETYPQFPRPWYAPGLKLANFFSLPRGIDYRKSMLFRYIAL